MKAIWISIWLTVTLGVVACLQNELVRPEESSKPEIEQLVGNIGSSMKDCEEIIVAMPLDCGAGLFGSVQYQVTNCFLKHRASKSTMLISSDTVELALFDCRAVGF